MSNHVLAIDGTQLPELAPAAPASESAAILSMIERAARDPSVSVDKLERLYELSERAKADRAREAFAAAFANLQAELPTIDRTGKIVVYSKADRDKQGGPTARDKPQQETPYATLDGILEAIRAPLFAHGFSIRFEHEVIPPGSPEGRIVTTSVLTHKGGHSERASTPPLMHDSSGSKNSVQAVGSALTYGRRYSLLAILPIVSHAPQDRDDDGKAAGATAQTIEPEQVAELQRLIVERGVDKPRFLAFCKVDSLLEIPAKEYPSILATLKQKAPKQ